jgi:hypothetical protein
VYVLQVFLLLRNNGSNSGAPGQDHDTDGVQSSPAGYPAVAEANLFIESIGCFC